MLKATEKKKIDKTRNVRVAAAAIVRPQTTLCGGHGLGGQRPAHLLSPARHTAFCGQQKLVVKFNLLNLNQMTVPYLLCKSQYRKY